MKGGMGMFGKIGAGFCGARLGPPGETCRPAQIPLAVHGDLRRRLARGNFHRIAREWYYDDPPATELGAQEAAFYGERRTRT